MSSSDPSADTPGMNMSTVFAPFFWGFFVSVFLGGITIVQAYMYFPHPTDPIFIQIIAALMLIMDLTSSGLVAQSLYYYLVPHFGSLLPLQSITPELSAECMLNSLLTFVAQMYFVYQIYAVTRKGFVAWTVIWVLALLTLLTLFGSVGCVVTMYMFPHGILADRGKDFAILFGIAKGLGAITDILATIAMCIFLSNADTGVRQTRGLIKNLIQYVVERGAVVTFIQTLIFITFYAAPNHLYWLSFHVNVTKLYANTFFAMLNARKNLREKYAPDKRSMFSLSRSMKFAEKREVQGKLEAIGPTDTMEEQNSTSSMPIVSTTADISV